MKTLATKPEPSYPSSAVAPEPAQRAADHHAAPGAAAFACSPAGKLPSPFQSLISEVYRTHSPSRRDWPHSLLCDLVRCPSAPFLAQSAHSWNAGEEVPHHPQPSLTNPGV